MSLRTRIMVAFAYLLLLAVIALSIPLGVNLARRARDDFAVQLNNRIESVAAQVPQALDDGGTALKELIAEQPELGRIIVIDRDAKLIADSIDKRRLGRDYAYRPEIVAALEGRTTRLVRRYQIAIPQYLVAVPVIDDGRVIGAVRVNRPVSEVDALVRRRLMYLAAGSCAILVTALLISVVIARSLARPLRRLGEVASSIGDGNLGAQAPASRQPEVAEVAAALNGMSRRLEQMMRAQTDFVANASHQLRTPLTGLRLRLEAFQAAGVKGAEAALAETDRLARLVDDLLTLVRTGSAPPAEEYADLAVAGRTAIDRWTVHAQERGHTLHFEQAGQVRPVISSPGDLAIILDNLIENALKYTPDGTAITVRIAPDDGGALLAVSDDGPGMAEEDKERAFERFYRGLSGRAVKGTGLGLAIVRQIVERWSGTVEIHLDGGTCVEVYLPVGDQAARATETTDRIPTLH